jgi:hypothetical protein
MIQNLTVRVLLGVAVAFALYYVITAAWNPGAAWEFAVILLLCLVAAAATVVGLGRDRRAHIQH